MKYLYFTILSCCLFFAADAQTKTAENNITGQWEGSITQNEGGYRTTYHIKLYLNQDGDEITGRSHVSIEEIYATIELKGTIKMGKMVFLEETKILDHRKYEDMEWCIKKMQLTLVYKDDAWRLNGYWQGKSPEGDCIPGKIYLSKEVPRA